MDHKSKKLLSTPKVRSWRALFNAYKTLSYHFERSLLELDCTVPRFQILLHLSTSGPLSPVDLSRQLKVSRANITTFIRRLTDDGLITATKENGTEKRPAYKLTKKGNKFFEKILPKHVNNVEELMPRFSEDFIKLLETIET